MGSSDGYKTFVILGLSYASLNLDQTRDQIRESFFREYLTEFLMQGSLIHLASRFHFGLWSFL